MASIYYHGSPDSDLQNITEEGIFGGIFGTDCKNVAAGHGQHVYKIQSPNPFPSDQAEVDGFWDACLDVCDGDEEIAEAIFCDSKIDDEQRERLCEITEVEEYDYSGEWSLQKLRGQAAAKIGYTSIESADEHGTSHLCLPGCTLQTMS